MISHLAEKELLYKSYLNDVIMSSLFIVKCKGNYPHWLFATYGKYDSSLPIHDLLTSVTIILLRIKLNKMLNIKTKSDTFQILAWEEFSKRTNARNWEGCDHAKICTKSIFSNQTFAVYFDT